MYDYTSLYIMLMSILYRMSKKKVFSKVRKQDWIDLGLKILTESGVEAVRVEPLAKILNVTKGSFYWHFKNRRELLDAILQDWVSCETERIIEQVEATGDDASTKLLCLFELATADDGRLENAIRAWATKDSQVAAITSKVDQRRLNYTKDLFLEVGFKPFEAMVRGRMAYYSLIGEFTIGTRINQAERLAEIRLQHTILTRK